MVCSSKDENFVKPFYRESFWEFKLNLTADLNVDIFKIEHSRVTCPEWEIE